MEDESDFDEDDGIGDDRLKLIFTCCNPALSPEARVALTLREVCGLTTEEIARAFLVSPSTLAQRIVRAKTRSRKPAFPIRCRARMNCPNASIPCCRSSTWSSPRAISRRRAPR